MTRTFPRRLPRPRGVLVPALAGFLLQSCAGHFWPGSAPDDPCSALQRVVEQVEDGFDGLKGDETTAGGSPAWKADPIFPGSDCLVVESPRGKPAYRCTRAVPDRAAAEKIYAEETAAAQACLGPGWDLEVHKGRTGAATLFGRSADRTHVVLRFFQPRGASGQAWENSLSVGDDAGAEAL
jgi:hypothetical protein